ncbi:hypothetical protein D5S17_18290 [Pseudonocardiaceae bacterium YIM PH 21723]|nr:hypothetical protein D5S17_18290 [Pseudonocardiaceae bacterium YIM PH 21723]
MTKPELEVLRDWEPPRPPRVDIDQAIAAGTRRQRWRAGITLAAVILGVLAVVGIPILTVGLSDDREPAGTVGLFDPLRVVFSVGKAGGFEPESYRTGQFEQRAVLRLEKGQQGAGAGTVTVYPVGRAPGQRLDPRWRPAGGPATDVRGRPAVWTADHTLSWEWAPNAWAVAEVDEDFPDLRIRIEHIAESVETGKSIPVSVSFTLLRPQWPLIGVIVPTDRNQWGDPPEVKLIFGPDSKSMLHIEIAREPRASLRQPDTKLGDRDAYVEEGRVNLFDPNANNGLTVVASSSTALAEFGGQQRLIELALSLRSPAGPVEDPFSR